ncbi:MAG: phosphatidylserine decarboxylase [Anaerolineae bacterium]|nr:phosphatidylserine decarboxylase [Anaerolineae bacterium]
MLWRIPLARFLRWPLLSLFSRVLGIDLAEAERPLRDYRSVHDFFVRRLKPDARPMPPDADAVCCPADGRIVEIGQATAGKVMNVKGMGFALSDLLANNEAAQFLEGGPYLIVHLSPGDYHRVHAPVRGHVVAWHHVPGRLFSVNKANLRREPGLFARNERLVTIVHGDSVGPCACVLVAAFGVGDITLSCDAEVRTHARRFSDGSVRAKRFSSPPHVHKGEELGIFHLGSTVIVVFAPGQVELTPLRPGTRAKVGQVIGRVAGCLPEQVPFSTQ